MTSERASNVQALIDQWGELTAATMRMHHRLLTEEDPEEIERLREACTSKSADAIVLRRQIDTLLGDAAVQFAGQEVEDVELAINRDLHGMPQ